MWILKTAANLRVAVRKIIRLRFHQRSYCRENRLVALWEPFSIHFLKTKRFSVCLASASVPPIFAIPGYCRATDLVYWFFSDLPLDLAEAASFRN
jgi:hypothetical protein